VIAGVELVDGVKQLFRADCLCAVGTSGVHLTWRINVERLCSDRRHALIVQVARHFRMRSEREEAGVAPTSAGSSRSLGLFSTT